MINRNRKICEKCEHRVSNSRDKCFWVVIDATNCDRKDWLIDKSGEVPEECPNKLEHIVIEDGN